MKEETMWIFRDEKGNKVTEATLDNAVNLKIQNKSHMFKEKNSPVELQFIKFL